MQLHIMSVRCLLDKSLLERFFSILSNIGGSTVFVTSDASMVRKLARCTQDKDSHFTSFTWFSCHEF